MTTVCHVMPMMTSNSIVIVLIAIIAIFALVGYACVRVGDDEEPHINRAERMHLLTEKSSKRNLKKILRLMKRKIKYKAKHGCNVFYIQSGWIFNSGKQYYISHSMLEQIKFSAKIYGFNVDELEDDIVQISW